MLQSKVARPPISRRELEVARAYTEGKTYRQIADDLNISPATVRTHISNIYRKLEVSSKIELLHSIDTGPAPQRVWHRAWLLAPLLGLLGIGGLAGAYLMAPSPVSAPAALPALRNLALVSFKDDGDASARDVLVRDLVVGLTQHADLFVVEPSQASLALPLDSYARQLSESINLRFVLYGAAQSKGGVWEVSATLFDSAAGTAIWSDVFRGAAHDSLSLRLAMLDSLRKVVHLPAPDQSAARCLEMTEHLAQTFDGAPVEKVYKFKARGPRYCQGDASGPR